MDGKFPLREFRVKNDLSLDEMSQRLGVHKTTAMRLETGELPVDADMVEKILMLTGGTVTGEMLHAVRLAWLRANRPEKFEGVEEAAE